MKKFLHCVLVGTIFAIPCVTIMTSCSNDDDVTEQTVDERQKTEVTNSDAGEFKVTNISYQGTEDGLSLSALSGDTLKIIFTPKSEYSKLAFEKNYEGLEQINDSLYRVKDSRAGTHEYKLVTSGREETNDAIVNLSAKGSLKVNIPEAYVIMPYIIGMTDDLQKLVTPKVTYSDAEGKNHTFMVRDEDLTKKSYDDFTTYFYTFNVRYYKIGITSSVSVTYVPRSNIQLNQERYYMYHSLRKGRADVHIPGLIYVDNSISLDISINIGGEGGIPKGEVPAALEKLKNTPDVLRFDIFKDDGITEL